MIPAVAGYSRPGGALQRISPSLRRTTADHPPHHHDPAGLVTMAKTTPIPSPRKPLPTTPTPMTTNYGCSTSRGTVDRLPQRRAGGRANRKRDELLAATEALFRHRQAGGPGHPGGGRPASGKPSAKSPINTRWARTSTTRSPTPASSSNTTTPPLPRRPLWMASACCAPACPPPSCDAAGVVTGYKNLAHLERDFSIIKTDDPQLHPIHHRLTERVKAHVLICLLACYLTWHLRI